MPAVSKKQQRFFGMVRAAQKGEMENPSPEVAQAASSMSKSDVKKFAKTKHDKLPEKKKVEEGVGLTVARAIDKTKPPIERPSVRRKVSSALKMREVIKNAERNKKRKFSGKAAIAERTLSKGETDEKERLVKGGPCTDGRRERAPFDGIYCPVVTPTFAFGRNPVFKPKRIARTCGFLSGLAAA